VKRAAAPVVVLLFAFAAAPAAGAGAGEPGTLVLGSLSARYAPVVFGHAAHVSTAGGCADCHHQHGTGPGLSCPACHALDEAAFRKAVGATRFRRCGECHPAAPRRDDPGTVPLKAAYHRACFRCHRGEVGTVGEDPRGCTQMCHARKEGAP